MESAQRGACAASHIIMQNDLSTLRSIPNLYADPYRPPLPPPFFSAALKQRADAFWRRCASSPPGTSRIPNAIHQPWLHGTTVDAKVGAHLGHGRMIRAEPARHIAPA